MNANTTIIPEQITMDIGTLESSDPKSFVTADDMYDVVTFRECAPDLDDRQVLGYILTLSASRDRDALVETLLEYFGSLKNVLEARPEQLRAVKGVGEKTAKLIASFVPVMRAWKRRMNETPERLGNSNAAENYCMSLLQGERVEKFYVICLNAQCDVVGKRLISSGAINEVSAYPRLVVETALNYNANTVILSHNHPGGTRIPSVEDITSTLQLQRLLNGLNIMLLDHIIVAGDGTYSMVQHGDIDYRKRS